MSEYIYSSGEIASLKDAFDPAKDTTGYLKLAKVTYDFAELGGAVGAIPLGLTLPDNAIIWDGCGDILTAFTSTAGTGTIALGANTTNDLLGAVDADTLSGVFAIIPVGTAATAVKLTAARELTITVATNPILSGKAVFYIQYILSA